MSLGKLRAITAVGLSFLAIDACADTFGCTVMLCVANPAGWASVGACIPPVTQALRRVARGGSWPSCPEGGQVGGLNAQPYQNCPAGLAPYSVQTTSHNGNSFTLYVPVAPGGSVCLAPSTVSPTVGENQCGAYQPFTDAPVGGVSYTPALTGTVDANGAVIFGRSSTVADVTSPYVPPGPQVAGWCPGVLNGNYGVQRTPRAFLNYIDIFPNGSQPTRIWFNLSAYQ